MQGERSQFPTWKVPRLSNRSTRGINATDLIAARPKLLLRVWATHKLAYSETRGVADAEGFAKSM